MNSAVELIRSKEKSYSLLDLINWKSNLNMANECDLSYRKFPIKILATIQLIDTINFVVRLIADTRNFELFNQRLQKSYKNAIEWGYKQPPNEELATQMVYMSSIDGQACRCRIIKLNGFEALVYLVDFGTMEKTLVKDIHTLDSEFLNGEMGFPFVLRCATTGSQYLEGLGLPQLTEFQVGDPVEVIVCTPDEPCLAMVGSVNHVVNSLNHKTFTLGLDNESAEIWTELFTVSSVDPKPVHFGTYPHAQLPPNADNFLSTIVGLRSLNSVFVRDLLSSARICYLQTIIDEFYTSDANRQKLVFSDLKLVAVGLPCVIYDKGQYLRAKVQNFCSFDRTVADIVAIDYPLHVFYDVAMAGDKVYMLDAAFNISPQCVPIVLARNTLSKVASWQDEAVKKIQALRGQVAAVKISTKSALAVMSVGDKEDILAPDPITEEKNTKKSTKK